ncbi:dermonecrotic toxin domain-containing protein, partial [Pseudomonas asplenii]|uniref:dermonecrotic toxin domain-containing protein n=1 Tax=Pseudomonas asplenii TaxID=53407 RepID=UPI000378C42F
KSSLSPEAFAQRCRRLDLGRKYQQHLRQVLDDTNPAKEPLAPGNKHQWFINHQRNRFDAELQMAYLGHHLTHECVKALKMFLLPSRESFGKRLLCHRVKLLGQVLPGVIHFCADPDDDEGRCAIYFPEHPEYPFKEYSSLLMFQVMLISHLNSPATRQWVSQLLPLDHQEPLLLEKLRAARRAANEASAKLVNLSSWIEVELFEEIHSLRLLHLSGDLGRLAPAARNVKATEREKLLEEFQDARLDLLASLKDRIPRFKRALSDPLDLVGSHAIYQDIHTWSPEERLAGSLHLLNIAEAQASGQVTQRMRAEGHSLPELVRVRFKGHTRLWKPDPTLYRVPVDLSDEQWQTNTLGLYEGAKGHYLLLNESYYEVRYDGQTGHWHILGQTQPTLYAPPLRHNGVGAWRTLHEDVTQWPQSRLIARLSPRAAKLRRELAEALLPLGCTNVQTLRQLHQHNRRTSPLLLDSLKRLWILREIEELNPERSQAGNCTGLCLAIQSYLAGLLPDLPAKPVLRITKHQSRRLLQYAKGSQWFDIEPDQWIPGLFEHLYRHLEQPATPEQQRLHAQYPELPLSFLDDLEFTRQALDPPQASLPTLNQEIDRALEQIRVSRVFEGLHPDWPSSQQSEWLAFSLLETLAGWPQDMRLELMQAEASPCVPLPGIGTDSGLNYRRLHQTDTTYEIRNRQGETLSSTPDFHAALWQTLPSQARNDLGKRHAISQQAHQTSADLKRVLFAQAARLRSQVPAVRTLQRLLEPPVTVAAAPLPIEFAVPGRLVSGLQLRDEGIYWNLNPKPLANHAHRHYILERHRYYPVTWGPEGWRLLNASNPYGFYQPLLQRRSQSDPRWTLHHPDYKRKLLVNVDSLPVPADNHNHDDLLRKKMFTQAQRQRLLTPKSYRSCLNSPLAYDRVDNARYPLRDLEGQPMIITTLYYSSAAGTAQSLARAKQLLPYLRQGVEVARLYESRLVIRRFRQQHMRSTDEQHLVGRFHVSARNDLAQGELLGVHGGMLIPLLVCHHRKDPFATWVHEERSLELLRVRDGQPQAALPCLTGDNILSRINTIFEYEGGVPVRQALAGYNVEAVAFPVDVRVDDGCSGQQRYFINALFTSRAVMADEELRINHGYTEEQIQTLNSAQPLGPATAE